MKSILGKQFAKILERKEWQLIQVQGSYHIYTKPGESVRISIPIHGNKDLKIGLLHYFMKQAHLSEADLE
ncbi:type II toxin-antitoxin system HicA family toxin [Synechococcus sp. Nb3U1]|uniref:type II toxin-antitoxin system HicA family toxin n=1 Tax=Synechococcus sp. Nb3U1 TaxID=1914529 RepID=UPI001F1798C8|nr:type II toxin-antitoxin system HicA family toxin [Synechococcus sp. Nb3U1]MCF2971507.1 type II toxin-antitoxin system HicA family toxin [Synechococcus sp. Nb3U1]